MRIAMIDVLLQKIGLVDVPGGGGGGGGTSNYNDLTNKPQINGTTLQGNKSWADLGLPSGLTYKGTTQTTTTNPGLPTTGQKDGDLWYVQGDNDFRVWNSTTNAWDVIDMPNPSTTGSTTLRVSSVNNSTNLDLPIYSNSYAWNAGQLFRYTDAGQLTTGIYQVITQIPVGKTFEEIQDSIQRVATSGHKTFLLSLSVAFTDCDMGDIISLSQAILITNNELSSDDRPDFGDLVYFKNSNGALYLFTVNLNLNNWTCTTIQTNRYGWEVPSPNLLELKCIFKVIDTTLLDVRIKSFSATTNYAIGDCVIYNDNIYRFNTAHTAGAWNSSQVDLVSTGAPIGNSVIDEFNTTTNYAVGDCVIYQSNVWQFTAAHTAGAWNGNQATIVSVGISGKKIEAFSTSTTYAIGDIVIYNGNLYQFTSAHSAGTWNDSQVSLISSGLPQNPQITVFNTSTAYAVGDLVLYNDNLYQCSTSHAAGSWSATDFTLIGSDGSSNYNDLTNKPQINGITLTGNKTSADLGLTTPSIASYVSTKTYNVGDMINDNNVLRICLQNGTTGTYNADKWYAFNVSIGAWTTTANLADGDNTIAHSTLTWVSGDLNTTGSFALMDAVKAGQIVIGANNSIGIVKSAGTASSTITRILLTLNPTNATVIERFNDTTAYPVNSLVYNNYALYISLGHTAGAWNASDFVVLNSGVRIWGYNGSFTDNQNIPVANLFVLTPGESTGVVPRAGELVKASAGILGYIQSYSTANSQAQVRLIVSNSIQPIMLSTTTEETSAILPGNTVASHFLYYKKGSTFTKITGVNDTTNSITNYNSGAVGDIIFAFLSTQSDVNAAGSNIRYDLMTEMELADSTGAGGERIKPLRYLQIENASDFAKLDLSKYDRAIISTNLFEATTNVALPTISNPLSAGAMTYRCLLKFQNPGVSKRINITAPTGYKFASKKNMSTGSDAWSVIVPENTTTSYYEVNFEVVGARIAVEDILMDNPTMTGDISSFKMYYGSTDITYMLIQDGRVMRINRPYCFQIWDFSKTWAENIADNAAFYTAHDDAVAVANTLYTNVGTNMKTVSWINGCFTDVSTSTYKVYQSGTAYGIGTTGLVGIDGDDGCYEKQYLTNVFENQWNTMPDPYPKVNGVIPSFYQFPLIAENTTYTTGQAVQCVDSTGGYVGVWQQDFTTGSFSNGKQYAENLASSTGEIHIQGLQTYGAMTGVDPIPAKNTLTGTVNTEITAYDTVSDFGASTANHIPLTISIDPSQLIEVDDKAYNVVPISQGGSGKTTQLEAWEALKPSRYGWRWLSYVAGNANYLRIDFGPSFTLGNLGSAFIGMIFSNGSNIRFQIQNNVGSIMQMTGINGLIDAWKTADNKTLIIRNSGSDTNGGISLPYPYFDFQWGGNIANDDITFTRISQAQKNALNTESPLVALQIIDYREGVYDSPIALPPPAIQLTTANPQYWDITVSSTVSDCDYLTMSGWGGLTTLTLPNSFANGAGWYCYSGHELPQVWKVSNTRFIVKALNAPSTIRYYKSLLTRQITFARLTQTEFDAVSGKIQQTVQDRRVQGITPTRVLNVALPVGEASANMGQKQYNHWIISSRTADNPTFSVVHDQTNADMTGEFIRISTIAETPEHDNVRASFIYTQNGWELKSFYYDVLRNGTNDDLEIKFINVLSYDRPCFRITAPFTATANTGEIRSKLLESGANAAITNGWGIADLAFQIGIVNEAI